MITHIKMSKDEKSLIFQFNGQWGSFLINEISEKILKKITINNLLKIPHKKINGWTFFKNNSINSSKIKINYDLYFILKEMFKLKKIKYKTLMLLLPQREKNNIIKLLKYKKLKGEEYKKLVHKVISKNINCVYNITKDFPNFELCEQKYNYWETRKIANMFAFQQEYNKWKKYQKLNKHLDKQKIFQDILDQKKSKGKIFNKNWIIYPGGSVEKILWSQFKIRNVSILERINNHGAHNMIFSCNFKQLYLKKIIAQLFVNNPYNFKYVTLIDNNHRNCNYKNIKWIEKPSDARKAKKLPNGFNIKTF